jgi:hypothetical protein
MSPQHDKRSVTLACLMAAALASALAACGQGHSISAICASALNFRSVRYIGHNLYLHASHAHRIGRGTFPSCGGVNGQPSPVVPVSVAAIDRVDPSTAVAVVLPNDEWQIFLRRGEELPPILKSVTWTQIQTKSGFVTPG